MRRWQSRPGRMALVAPTLGELCGPVHGTVELPHRMVWQPVALRRFDLDDPYQRCRAYEIVLREAVRFEELRSLLAGALLRWVWPDLYLPPGVRRAWEDHHPELAAPGTAAA
ncbi:hypothetical protein CIK06_14305 [Plantactinospora sp. KBS50]|nr:hypothetical protein [Plantactinospora sp. KBS50]ASW57697.1 hypothetical protein CIK06_14305 [Plantactinospora sp. KBS50]